MDLLFLFCALMLHRSVLTLSFSRGTPFAGVGNDLLTNLVFPTKALGDWRPDTILIYLTIPLTVRLHSANMLCKAILRHNPLHPHTN